MCAIGRDLDTSVGAQAPATAMLGTSAIGATPAPRRNTLLTGAASAARTGTGAGGTLLAPVAGKPTGGGGNSKTNVMQR